MRFKDFFNLQEGVDWGFFGELTAYLGGNEAGRLNYGTAKQFGTDAMLYVPIERGEGEIGQILAAARRMLERTGVDCVPDQGAFGGWRCGPSKEPHHARFMHTGESHITVAYGNELDSLFFQSKAYPSKESIGMDERLRMLEEAGLFDSSGRGYPMPVKASKDGNALIYGLARLFTDVPIVVLLKAECPAVLEVRAALGLPPPKSGYVTHITVAYAFPHHGDGIVSTNPKYDLPASAGARHDRSYLRSQGLPEWFTPLGTLPLAG